MDPVTQAFEAATLIVNTVQGIGALIARLRDRQRTLEQAAADADASRAQLDADMAADAPADVPAGPTE